MTKIEMIQTKTKEEIFEILWEESKKYRTYDYKGEWDGGITGDFKFWWVLNFVTDLYPEEMDDEEYSDYREEWEEIMKNHLVEEKKIEEFKEAINVMYDFLHSEI